MTAPELKPCPFCGSIASYFRKDERGLHSPYLECRSCGATIRGRDRQECQYRWNRRVEYDMRQRLIESEIEQKGYATR